MRLLFSVLCVLLSCFFFSSFVTSLSLKRLPLLLHPDAVNRLSASSSFNSTLFLEQLSSLASSDLSFVDRRVLHKSHHSNGAPFTAEEIPKLKLSFLRFFSLLFLEEVESITPSYDVDQYWHEFIMFTAAYRQFCHKHFERFVDHFPEDIESDETPMTSEQTEENNDRKEVNVNGWKVTTNYMKMLYAEDWEAGSASGDSLSDASCSSCGACVGATSNSSSGACGSCGSGGCSAKKSKKLPSKAGCGSCGAPKTTTADPTNTTAPTTAAPTTTASCGSGCGSGCGGEKASKKSGGTEKKASCGSCGGKKEKSKASCGSCGAGGCSAKKSDTAEKADLKSSPSDAACGSCGTKKPAKDSAACGSCGGKKDATIVAVA